MSRSNGNIRDRFGRHNVSCLPSALRLFVQALDLRKVVAGFDRSNPLLRIPDARAAVGKGLALRSAKA